MRALSVVMAGASFQVRMIGQQGLAILVQYICLLLRICVLANTVLCADSSGPSPAYRLSTRVQ